MFWTGFIIGLATTLAVVFLLGACRSAGVFDQESADIYRRQTKKDLSRLLQAEPECPDCAGHRFYSGPEGGLCTNIKCANPECGSEFNWCPPCPVMPSGFAERIGGSF